MAQTINTNIASLTAQRNLAASQKDAATAMQRLSSGLRINSAKDDAAGLAISNRLTSQINGINQAIRNANDGISTVQVAEGALSETSSILQRMRELAVQSANATYSDADRSKLNEEITTLKAEVDRIAQSTSFGDTKLLSGSFTNKTFQVGANAGETLSLTIDSAEADSIGRLNTVSMGTAGAKFETAQANKVTTSAMKEQELTFVVDGTQTKVTIAAGSSAKAIASDVSTQVGNLQATAETKVVIDDFDATDAKEVKLEVNGVAVTVTSGSAFTDDSFHTALVDAINQNSDLSSLTAAKILDSGNDDTEGTVITDSDGDDISIKIISMMTAVGGSSAADATVLDIKSGFTVVGDVLTQTDATRGTVNGMTVGETAIVTGAVTFTTSLAADKIVTVAGDEASAGAGVIAVQAGSGDLSVAKGTETLTDAKIDTVANANKALGIIDSALSTIDTVRSKLGAVQSRFDSVVANLANVAENSSAARSRIMDADFAAETAQLAKTQILQQAGISVLAQANAQPQNVLALLQ